MTLLFGSLALGLAIGLPVFVALGASAVLYILVAGIQPLIAVQQMFDGLDRFPLLAVPFFVLAGNLMNAGAITDRIYTFTARLVGHVRGGLGHVNILGSVIFAGMSGTAVADAGGLGTIELKAMRDEGYDTPFAVGITAASATLGPIIPPSLAMIVYGAVANVSVGRLFAAGILPGLLAAAALHVQVVYYAHRRNYPRSRRASLREVMDSFLRGLPALITPAIIIGGMMGGVFTPTEAAVIAVLWALVVAAFVYRTLTLGTLVGVLRETFETTAVIMVLVAVSTVFGWVLVRENVATEFSHALVSLASRPWQAMLLLNLILLIVGTFMETIAIILILTPIFMPVLAEFGIDPVQFGVVMVLNLMIGLMTPPVGLLLFVLARIARLDLVQTVRACAPFMIPLVIVLGLISLIPGITLLLPRLLYR